MMTLELFLKNNQINILYPDEYQYTYPSYNTDE